MNSTMNGDAGQNSAAAARGLPNLLALAAMVIRRPKLLVGCFALGLSLGLTYFFVATSKYESTAQVLVMKKDSKLPARGVENSSHESSVSEDLLSTHVQIIQSRQLVQQALEKNGYDQLPSIVGHLKNDEDAVDFVQQRLKVTRGGTGQSKSAHVLNVAFQHTSPEETEQILNAIVQSYREFVGEKLQDVGKEAAQLIQRAKDELGVDMTKSERQYQQFREQAPLLWKGDQSANIHLVRYEELEAALSKIRLKVSETKSRLEVVRAAVKLQDANNAPDLERLALLDSEHIERLNLLVHVNKGDANTAEFQATQPARLEGARAEHDSLLNLILKEKTLRTDLGPEHPQVQDVTRQIAMIQDFLQQKAATSGNLETKPATTPRDLVQAYADLMEHDLQTLEVGQKGLENLAKEEHDAAKKLISYELDGEILRKELGRKQELYDTVLERLREINLVKDYGGFLIEVLAPPALGEKVAPLLPLGLIAGGVLGLVVGVALSGAAEIADPLFRSPEEIASTLEIPILAQIPRFGLDNNKNLPSTKPGSKLVATLTTFHRPRSRASEVIRGFRTAVFFRLSNTKGKIIQLTSAKPLDGKSTVAANLSVSIAQAGQRVLLVDCDMRRPTVHKTFCVEPKTGLSDVLTGKVELDDAILETEIPNLFILPCGPIPANPAELLMSESFDQLLEVFRVRFDRVVLDTPPLLAVADPSIVATKADGVVLAVRLTKDSRMEVLRSKELLETSRGNIIGLAINAHDLTSYHRLASYGYGYGYGGYAYDAYNRDPERNVYYHEGLEEPHETTNGTNGKSISRNGS